jgi:hypothetical protein
MIIRVEVQFVVIVNDDRDLDLTNPLRWNLVYTDPDEDKVIYDVHFNEPKERTYAPKIKITKLMEPYEPED